MYTENVYQLEMSLLHLLDQMESFITKGRYDFLMHQKFNTGLIYLFQVKLQKLDVRVYLECILVPTAELSLCVHLCMYQQKVVKNMQ